MQSRDHLQIRLQEIAKDVAGLDEAKVDEEEAEQLQQRPHILQLQWSHHQAQPRQDLWSCPAIASPAMMTAILLNKVAARRISMPRGDEVAENGWM